ncbi:hypothetical protein ONS95_002447 [Cadophora gregata]|uniref:uncharacterized protein n=1 Tax=Cadophora gregata TaxID=51156 RepID=UPI0026DBFE96|nr:uncharacterized protein ONS95_002447 [Cadophora gregata]KAK0109771.1 hypothetical protein ONS95_002447 [Cadophora gregata]KAK0110599.1 hypothetical protein ONS96_002202 [Cadophora gregata f. sp. sojae]
MHVLWSRAAQARTSCSCRSCLHTATNIARRTTTAAGKRRVKVSDVFTACYSTILATAAVADMRVKEERRKEWDRVIAEAKAGTPTIERTPGRPANTEAAEANAATGFLSKWKTTRRCEVHYIPTAVRGPAVGHNSDLETKLRNMGSQLEDESSFVVEEPDLELPAREPKKPMHLVRMQDMVGRLAYQFLAWSKILTVETVQGNSDILLQTIQMRDRLQSLMAGFDILPLYEWKDSDTVKDQREDLHRSLHALCRITDPNDRNAINLMLAKISYNMLVSTSPPSMVTYNLLLAEFTRLGQPHLGQLVVNSFLHDSKFKPSRTTVKLILDHYRSKGDSNGFRSIVSRMQATRKGPDMTPCMRIKKRDLEYLVRPAVQEWAMNKKTILRDQALHQKTPRNAAIFDSLIKGSLELVGLQSAVRHIRSALNEGHVVHQDTLCSVIRACVDQTNLMVGLSLLRNILSLWEKGVGYMATVYTEDLRQLIHQLLVMCGFDTSLKSPKSLPIKASWDALQDLLHYMHLESLDEALNRCADFTVSLNQSLSLTRPAKAGDFDSQETPEVQQALDIGLSMQVMEDYATEEKLRAKHQGNLEIASRWSRLEALGLLVDARQKDILIFESELTSVLYAQLSDDQKAKYDAALTSLDHHPPSAAFIAKRRLLLRLREPELKQEVETVKQSGLPAVKRFTLPKGVALRSSDGASFRPSLSLPIRPRQSPFPISMPIETIRDEIELEAAAAS